MSEARKEEILSAAYEIVGHEGLEGLHARTVASVVGINHAAVHYYFRTRSDLLVAVAEYMLRRFQQDLDAFHKDADTPGAKLDAHLAQAEAYCRPQSRFAKNWLSLTVGSIKDEALAKILSDHFQGWTARVHADLDLGVADLTFNRESPFCDGAFLCEILIGLMVAAHSTKMDLDIAGRLDAISASLFGA